LTRGRNQHTYVVARDGERDAVEVAIKDLQHAEAEVDETVRLLLAVEQSDLPV